jgi:hypothetical protein
MLNLQYALTLNTPAIGKFYEQISGKSLDRFIFNAIDSCFNKISPGLYSEFVQAQQANRIIPLYARDCRRGESSLISGQAKKNDDLYI